MMAESYHGQAAETKRSEKAQPEEFAGSRKLLRGPLEDMGSSVCFVPRADWVSHASLDLGQCWFQNAHRRFLGRRLSQIL
jgi:hypothetical protein